MKMLTLHEADERGVVAAGSLVTALPECLEATVRKEINGEYSLEATFPRDGRSLNELTIGRALRATVDEGGTEQFFIIKRRIRSLTGGLHVYAEHQSYLFNGLIVGAGAATPNGQPRVVFEALRTAAKPSITDIATWTYSRSNSLRANFPERQVPIPLTEALKDYLIGTAGGELIFDGFDVEYVDAMGEDRGAIYRYGSNITELESEDILENYASGIYPFWGRQGDESKPITILSTPVMHYPGVYPVQSIVPVDLTDRFETQPTEAELMLAAWEYVNLNKPDGVPISIRASRARIYGDVPVTLGDTVTVICTPWGMSLKTRVQALTFDALRGRVQDVEFGTINPGFAGAVKKMK